MTIGERFKEVRKLADEPKKKCSQADFGEMFKIGRDAVANIENGRVEPSDLLIRSVCSKFDVSYSWLCNEEGPMILPEPDDDTEFINDLLAETDNALVDIIRSIMEVYRELDSDGKEKARSFAANLKNKMKENRF